MLLDNVAIFVRSYTNSAAAGSPLDTASCCDQQIYKHQMDENTAGVIQHALTPHYDKSTVSTDAGKAVFVVVKCDIQYRGVPAVLLYSRLHGRLVSASVTTSCDKGVALGPHSSCHVTRQQEPLSIVNIFQDPIMA